MISLPVLAEAAAQAPSVVDTTIKPIVHNFGLNLPNFIGQVVNFCIVAFVLWKFAFKPVIATLDERQKKIADGLRYAEETKAKLEAVQQENAEILRKAQVEAASIIEQSRKAAKELAERETAAASARANELITKAQQAIDLEKQKMLAEARAEIARLVVTTTQRVLAKELNDADRGRYNEAAARELASA